MTAKEKIIQYIDYKGISKRDFYRQTGFSNGFLDSGKHIGSDNIKIIISNYPDISLDWLVMDDGEMIKTKNAEITNKKNVSENVSKDVSKQNIQNLLTNNEKAILNSEIEKGVKLYRSKGYLEKMDNSDMGIPLIPVAAMAGWGTGDVQIMDYETSRYNVPEFTELKAEFMIRMKGSSMYPKYNSGDLLACKKLFLRDIFFQWNKVYVLDTEQGALIKRIKKSSQKDCITCVSDNPSYDPFDLHLEKVRAIAIVIGVIRLD